MHRCLTLLLALALAGCTSNAHRIDGLAAASGFVREPYQAGPYTALIYMRRDPAGSGAPLAVFFEGDGRPWQAAIEPDGDPTSEHPVAMDLALRTPGSVAYITRPCYQELGDAACSREQWTSARYSNDVVESLASSVREAATRMNAKQVQLVGYSGGGTLAVLVAERLNNVAGVVTIAANLDTEAWATKHGYRPLSQSLNPALSERAHPWRELHLLGGRDEIVPPASVAKYFETRPQARRWQLDEADHVCCWVERWRELWPQIAEKMDASPPW